MTTILLTPLLLPGLMLLGITIGIVSGLAILRRRERLPIGPSLKHLRGPLLNLLPPERANAGWSLRIGRSQLGRSKLP